MSKLLRWAVAALVLGSASVAGKQLEHRGLLGTWQIHSPSSQYPAKRTEIRAGNVIGSSTMAVAADGQSFTAASRRSAPEDGHLYTSTIVWKRVAGSS